MQATRQNTRQLASGANEIMEWFTYGFEWSILNYGPGTLWFSYTPGVDAIPGEVQATRLEPGFSFTDSAAAPRMMEVSLHAEAGNLTYCLNTNQRYAAGALPPGAGDVEEAPVDGILYGRRDRAWHRAVDIAGDIMTGRLTISADPIATLALNGDRISDLVLGREASARWILGCTHFTEPGYPFGLYILRMNADGSAIIDFPFSIRRADGHVVLNEAEAERMIKRANLNQATLDEFVTRFFVENNLAYVRRIGDTMTGSLIIDGGGIVIRNIGGPIPTGFAIIRLDAGEGSFLEYGDTGGLRWISGAMHVGPNEGFLIGRGPVSSPTRDFFIYPNDGRVEVRGLTITGELSISPLRLNGATVGNAEFAFSENNIVRWSILGQYGLVSKGPGLYFYRMNGGTILGEALFLSHATGEVQIEVGATIRGPLTLATPGGQLSIQTINAPGLIQFFRPGLGRWYFGTEMGLLPSPQNDLCFYRSDATGSPVDVPIQIAADDGHVALQRPRTISGDPITDNELTRRAYVDRLTEIEPLQVLTFGPGWENTPESRMQFRRMHARNILEVIGMGQRQLGGPIGNAWTLIGNLPAGYRYTEVQYKIVMCLAETGGALVTGIVGFTAAGDLICRAQEASSRVYLNEFFTINPTVLEEEEVAGH